MKYLDLALGSFLAVKNDFLEDYLKVQDDFEQTLLISTILAHPCLDADLDKFHEQIQSMVDCMFAAR